MAEETLEEKVKKLEIENGMPRWAREELLKDGSVFPEAVKQKAQMIEDLAKQLRPSAEEELLN